MSTYHTAYRSADTFALHVNIHYNVLPIRDKSKSHPDTGLMSYHLQRGNYGILQFLSDSVLIVQLVKTLWGLGKEPISATRLFLCGSPLI